MRSDVARSLGEQITRRVAILAAERGLSLEKVTTAAGLPPGSLEPIDATWFNVDDIERLCRALGIESATLLFEPAAS